MPSERIDDRLRWGEERTTARAVRVLNYSVRLFTVAGIDVRLHWSFVFVVLVFASWTAVGESALARIGWGAAQAAILYSLVLLHELCHAAAAAVKGRRTDRIMLTPLGGTAVIDGAMGGPGMEAEVAVAGPAVNLLILGLLVAGAAVSGRWDLASGAWTSPVLSFLFQANLALALFNLIPAYPLDGGRVARAILAWRRGERRGTRVAARLGQVLSVGMVVGGVWMGSPAGWVLACIGVSNVITCETAIRRVEMGFPVYDGGSSSVDYGAAASAGLRAVDRDESPEDQDRRVDEVLAKVSRQGLGSLTRRERAILKQASKRYRQSSR